MERLPSDQFTAVLVSCVILSVSVEKVYVTLEQESPQYVRLYSIITLIFNNLTEHKVLCWLRNRSKLYRNDLAISGHLLIYKGQP